MSLRLALATTLALAGLAAPASAAESVWDVTFEGTGAYAGNDAWCDNSGNCRNWTSHAELSFRQEIGQVVFRDGKLVLPNQWAQPQTGTTVARVNAGSTLEVIGGNAHKKQCSGSTTDIRLGQASGYNTTATAGLSSTTAIPAADAPETLVLQPFWTFDFKIPCTTTQQHPDEDDFETWYDLGRTGVVWREHPWSALFTMPAAALAQDKVIHVVKSDPKRFAYFCGAQDDHCAIQWSGTITMIRTRHAGDDLPPLQDPLPPPPPPAPNPTPFDDLHPLVPPPAPDPFEDLAPLVPPERASLSPKADKATVQVTCPSGCAGTIKAYAAAPGAKASAAKPIATARFTGAAKARKVTMRFKPAARRAIKRAGGVRLVVTATPKGGTATRTTIRLRARR